MTARDLVAGLRAMAEHIEACCAHLETLDASILKLDVKVLGAKQPLVRLVFGLDHKEQMADFGVEFGGPPDLPTGLCSLCADPAINGQEHPHARCAKHAAE